MRFTNKGFRRYLEMSANIGIVIVAIILVGNFAWSRLAPKRAEKPIVGNKISLPGVNWSAGNTLVLALQKGCKYCEESAAFYHRLRDQTANSKARMLAVVPGDKNDISRYLSDQGVSVDDIINVPLSDVNVSATPTLLIVDSSGIIRNVWVGKLDESKEGEVTRRVLESH